MPDFIDLGISDKDDGPVEAKEMSGKRYPCVYITSKEPIEFGEKGLAEIRYKLIESAERNREGNEEYRYELELHGVKPTEVEEDDKPKKGLTQNFGEALDKAEARRNKSDY